MGGRIQNYIILMEEKMNTDANKTIDFEKKLKEKLGKVKNGAKVFPFSFGAAACYNTR